ncbi:MAG: hypothetical protein IJE08_15165 [Clostridia bacterium]|nr:hypothetical protein [Clostridia bacterium]
MKASAIGGIVTGLAIGAAAAGAYGMMSRQQQRKLRTMAMRSGKMLTNKASELFGK